MAIHTSPGSVRAPGGKLRSTATTYPTITNAWSVEAGQSFAQSSFAASAASYQQAAGGSTAPSYAPATSGYRGINAELLTTYRP